MIEEAENRIGHLAVAYAALKPGGVAYFKTWADCWPTRGSGVGSEDKERGTYQVQRWADAYLPELEAVSAEEMPAAIISTRSSND